jgi:hypothetical protein
MPPTTVNLLRHGATRIRHDSFGTSVQFVDTGTVR